MGCTVTTDERRHSPSLATPARRCVGIDVDMADVSDLVPTLAVVAAAATTPTTIRGVGFIRAKESDRLGDLAAELTKTGADIVETDDGLHVEPVPPGALHGAHARHAPRPSPGHGLRRARHGGPGHRSSTTPVVVEELARLLERLGAAAGVALHFRGDLARGSAGGVSRKVVSRRGTRGARGCSRRRDVARA